jgi:hypothetical protein
MELSSAQRKVAFAVIVLVLAGLGISLLKPAAHGTPSGARASTRPTAHSTGGRSAPAASPSATPPGAASPGQATSPAPATAVPDIYRWLPFTPTELAAASRVALKFAGDYDTFSYSQNAAGYLAPMRNLVTSQLASLLARAYSTPGVASQRASTKQVSSGTAVISSLRAFGPSSLTFVMAITQSITDTKGRSQSTMNFAVTVTNSGGWQVSDIESASAGNQ